MFVSQSQDRTTPKTLSSLRAVAKHFGISDTAVFKTKRQHADDFPSKHDDGYHLDELDDFAKRNSIWTYSTRRRRNGHGKTNGHDQSYNQARINYLQERTAREKIVKEQAFAQQQIQLGNILLADDVFRFYEQTVALVMTLIDSLHDAHDRELPEQCPTPEAWPELRERILKLDTKLTHDVAAAMKDLQG